MNIFQNIFQNFTLVNKVTKAIKEVKALKDANSEVIIEITEIIADLIKILERLKEVLPSAAEAVEDIIERIKKIFKK